MSRTRKDSRKVTNWLLEVVGREDLTFDVSLNRKIERSKISERDLRELLCIRFGFCGEEYEMILREVHQNGRKEIVWG